MDEKDERLPGARKGGMVQVAAAAGKVSIVPILSPPVIMSPVIGKLYKQQYNIFIELCFDQMQLFCRLAPDKNHQWTQFLSTDFTCVT